MKRLFLWLMGCGAAMAAAAAGPTDNLRADYRNPVRPMEANGGVSQNYVQLGLGSGVFWTTNRITTSASNTASWGTNYRFAALANLTNQLERYWQTPNVRSTIGVPIAAVSANKFLGEPLEPPKNWSGAAPIITANTGGKAVWVDFAKQVITSQAGPIEVRWPLTGGGYETENSVVAASPSKRPVRLYWTHARPEYGYGGYIFKPLQNAGPTVQFGSNYKVHIYSTGAIKQLVSSGYELKYIDENGDSQSYDPNDECGYVRLEGQELQALEGSRGTFLIVYSRLDEALNERVMLAYELVEVLEPTQTQIDIGIGDQLKPQSRSFNTDELFPMVTRGLTDDADNGEIYVYQHSSGDQKNFLWAIRDSSANPWKIEVYWRAKEELDVVWPFEVDIYAASWNDAVAQTYLRDCDETGKAQIQPKVYFPNALAVEAMDYQVVGHGTDKEKEQKHVHIESGAFYTDYADEGTYALLKYTSGDTIWFQTVKSVSNLKSARSNGAATLAQEIQAPESYRIGEGGYGERFFYPGWIRRAFETDDPNRYPVKNAYNPNFYQYPTEWATTNELYSPIFPVNIGQLEVWWSRLSNLYGTIRDGSGHVEEMKSHIFFPSQAYKYSMDAPREGYDFDDITPQIVLASGKGSAGWSLNDNELGLDKSEAINLNLDEDGVYADGGYGGSIPAYFVTDVPVGETQEVFTVENWISFQQDGGWYYHYDDANFDEESWSYPSYDLNYKDVNPANGVGWLAFHAVDAERNVSATPHLTLRVDLYANLWVNGVKKTNFTSANLRQPARAALPYGEDGRLVLSCQGLSHRTCQGCRGLVHVLRQRHAGGNVRGDGHRGDPAQGPVAHLPDGCDAGCEYAHEDLPRRMAALPPVEDGAEPPADLRQPLSAARSGQFDAAPVRAAEHRRLRGP